MKVPAVTKTSINAYKNYEKHASKIKIAISTHPIDVV